MVVNCEEVWREISNYVENDVNPELRSAMEAHFKECRHCTAVLDGARNVVQLYGDDRMVELPAGFSQRLRNRLEREIPQKQPRRAFMMWAMAAAATLLLAGGVETVRRVSGPNPSLRSEQAQPGIDVPPDMLVVVSTDGKMFHGGIGCKLLHDKAHARTITAREAAKEGFTPCTECLRKYLRTGLVAPRQRMARAELAAYEPTVLYRVAR